MTDLEVYVVPISGVIIQAGGLMAGFYPGDQKATASSPTLFKNSRNILLL